MHTIHSQRWTVHISTVYVRHSHEHKHVPHPPGTHVACICTHSSHRCSHEEKMYRWLPTMRTPHTLDTNKHTTHTGTQNSQAEGVPGTQVHTLHLLAHKTHAHSHITYTALCTHTRTPRPTEPGHTQVPFPSPLSPPPCSCSPGNFNTFPGLGRTFPEVPTYCFLCLFSSFLLLFGLEELNDK